jgi:hypothetical protein
MLDAKDSTLTGRFIAPPPFPTLPIGALAPKVTKLRRQRYLFEQVSFLPPSGGCAQVGPTLGLDGGMRLEVELTCVAQGNRKVSPTQV